MLLNDSDPQNPAMLRAAMDDKVTFLPNLLVVDNPMAPKYTKMATPTDPNKVRGLTPDSAGSRLVDKMSPGPLKKVQNTSVDPTKQEYEASNPSFDPKTKQVFAALNYGRRPHGSSTRYGYSSLVLDDGLKGDAIYYAGDTFLSVFPGMRNSAVDAISYKLLFAIFAMAPAEMRQDLRHELHREKSMPRHERGEAAA